MQWDSDSKIEKKKKTPNRRLNGECKDKTENHLCKIGSAISIKGLWIDCSKSVQLSDRSQNLNFFASNNLIQNHQKCSG